MYSDCPTGGSEKCNIVGVCSGRIVGAMQRTFFLHGIGGFELLQNRLHSGGKIGIGRGGGMTEYVSCLGNAVSNVAHYLTGSVLELEADDGAGDTGANAVIGGL